MKNLKNILISAVLFLAVSQIVHQLFAFAGMGYYTDPAYAGVWSKIMMPGPGAPPAEFYYLSIAVGFITALIYVVVYNKIRAAIPGKTLMNKGLNYGLWIIFILGTVPGYLAMYLLINLPAGLVALWAAESLVIALVGGIVIAKFNSG
jgi:predicted neutral ceramidase superfamily lipid hydrolase